MNRNEYAIRLIQIFSVVLNMAVFLAVIAQYPPCFYTNDDYRMMTIAAGAYTGTPSADMVFMMYPVGMLLAGLYSVTTKIPWYGVFTMLCMFIPSCIFCHYIVKKAYLKKCTVLGVILYLFLFVFVIRKYICLPQFTLTSAFMGTGAVALFHEMPEKKNKKHIALAVLCSAAAFAVRPKAFYLLLPLIGLIMIVRIINEKELKKSFIVSCLSILMICGCIYIVDYDASNRNAEYQYFEEFNEARSEVYDYGGVPFYYDNLSFYTENGINERIYRALAARYLDLDDSVDADTFGVIGNYMKDIRENSGSIIDKVKIAFEENIEYWLDSGDEIVKYSTVFVLLLLSVTLIFFITKKRMNIIFPAATAGLLLESLFFMYSGRIVVRIVDALLLPLGVIGCLAVLDVLIVRKETISEIWSRYLKDKKKWITGILVIGSVGFLGYSVLSSLNVAMAEKYYSVTVTQNSRSNSLKNYAELHSDSFFFYDSNDFISCTEYLFKTYDEGKILNHDSLGSWNVCAPTYYERNEQFGFTTPIEGLINAEEDVYFVTISSPKLGISKLLKEKYNKTLMLADTISSDNYSLYIYMVVDDD